MGTLVISFLLSIGTCAWLYPKIYNRSGADNARQTFTLLAIIGLTLFIILFIFLNLFI